MTTRRTSCDIHAPGDPTCVVQDATPTYYGRVELRDGPDYGHVSGEWTPAHDARQIIGDLLVLLGAGIVVAAFVWAIFVLLAAMA